MLPLFLLVASCICQEPPSDCIFDPVTCYQSRKRAGRCLCWPTGPVPIDTRTCGGNYLNVRQVRAHPCTDQCIPVPVYHNGHHEVAPHPWKEELVHEVADTSLELPEWVDMDEDAFCDMANWDS